MNQRPPYLIGNGACSASAKGPAKADKSEGLFARATILSLLGVRNEMGPPYLTTSLAQMAEGIIGDDPTRDSTEELWALLGGTLTSPLAATHKRRKLTQNLAKTLFVCGLLGLDSGLLGRITSW